MKTCAAVLTTSKGATLEPTNPRRPTARTAPVRLLHRAREQQANPQYADLTFEDRLSLLLDAECSQRRENRVKRNIRVADFPMQAALEDLDFSPGRGLDRRFVLELG
jgi:hypothetical protein